MPKIPNQISQQRLYEMALVAWFMDAKLPSWQLGRVIN
jgi:hypothetical protein